jgi:uncharacterized protein YndB with AHSA1/START domain
MATFTHMPKTNLQQQIFIDALPSKVWKVLTTPDYIDQYLLEGNVHCQWIEGSPITLAMEFEGKLQTIHKGNILQVVPGVLLKYNLREENTADPVTITYQLIPAEDSIELKYQCEGFNDSNEDYFFRIQQTKLLLQKIKWLAEYA